jgi:hypothetical protein
MFGRKKRDERAAGAVPAAPADVYLGLRTMALESVVRGTVTTTAAHPRVGGVVIDVPSSGGFATIVALGDNTTSLYTSVGGGTIGAGRHKRVADATHRLLAVIDAHLGLFSDSTDDALPDAGVVRFHVLARDRSTIADVAEDSFWTGASHPLMPVIAATQELITAIRSVDVPPSTPTEP